MSRESRIERSKIPCSRLSMQALLLLLLLVDVVVGGGSVKYNVALRPQRP